jgi:lipopolysaccharide export system protein LptA
MPKHVMPTAPLKNLLPWLLAVAIVVDLTGGAPAAGQDSPSTNGAAPQPVEITADRLVSQGNRNAAEFIGNVVAAQGDFTIHSDTLRISFRRSAQNGATAAAEADSIEKIEAIGHVKITAEERRAETDRAEYRLQEDVLELVGENSFVTDGKNTLTGSRITWNRKTGNITVAGSKKSRVKAVFYSTEALTPETPKPAPDSTKPPRPK